VPDTVEVVNPHWRQLDSQVRGERAVLARKKGDFAALVLKGEIDTDTVEEFLSRKQALQEEIQHRKFEWPNSKSSDGNRTAKSRSQNFQRQTGLISYPPEQTFYRHHQNHRLPGGDGPGPYLARKNPSSPSG